MDFDFDTTLTAMPDDVAGKVLWAAGHVAQQLGDEMGCLPLLEKARELRDRAGDASGATHCVFCLGMAAVDRADYAAAMPYLAEAHDAWMGLNDRVSAVYAEFFLARASLGLGDLAGAATWGKSAYDQSVTLRSGSMLHASLPMPWSMSRSSTGTCLRPRLGTGAP